MVEGVIGIIPARSGSVSVKNKNIRELGGFPLIAWSIGAAKRARSLSRVFVSTDSYEYAAIAKRFGAEVPFLRSKELAEDVPTELVIKDALHRLELPYTRAIATIQPTTPLVRPEDIDACVEKCLERDTQSCMTVCEITERPEWMFAEVPRPADEGWLKPWLAEVIEITPQGSWGVRQTLPKLYRPNGACYVTRDRYLRVKDRIIGDNCKYVLMPRSRSFDIDTEDDFQMLEAYLAKHPEIQRFQ